MLLLESGPGSLDCTVRLVAVRLASRLLALAGAAGMVLSAVLPWVTIHDLELDRSRSAAAARQRDRDRGRRAARRVTACPRAVGGAPGWR
jgi:hypothetical protein